MLLYILNQLYFLFKTSFSDGIKHHCQIFKKLPLSGEERDYMCNLNTSVSMWRSLVTQDEEY